MPSSPGHSIEKGEYGGKEESHSRKKNEQSGHEQLGDGQFSQEQMNMLLPTDRMESVRNAVQQPQPR